MADVLAIDPGREKCGVCLIDVEGEIKFQRVIDTARLSEIVADLSSTHDLRAIVLGDGTSSKSAVKSIESALKSIDRSVSIVVVDEKHTTEQARVEYWQKKPPRGWRRFLPTSMQVPPEPVDDIVAEILAKRFIAAND